MVLTRLLSNLLFAALLAAGCAAFLVVVNEQAAPQTRSLPPEGTTPPDYKAITAGVTEEAVRKDLEALRDCGPRYTGTPGCDKAADRIAARLRELGYEVLEQRFPVTVPVTRNAVLQDESGQPLAGLRIHPLMPNWFRPCSTPESGVIGKVLAGKQGLAAEFEGRDLRGQIALLPLGTPWATVAGMGARAVLYYDDGSPGTGQTANWDHETTASLDIPRFLVEGPARELDGRQVRLAARVDWQEVTARNIIGFLAPPEGGRDAILGTAHYDAYGLAPDLAFGAEQSGGVTALLAAAAPLAAEAKGLKRTLILAFTGGHAQGLAGMRAIARALGTRTQKAQALQEAVAEAAEARERAASLDAALAVSREGAWWRTDETGDDAFWRGRPAGVRERFEETARRLLDDAALAAFEAALQTRVDWVRDGQRVVAKGSDGQSAPAPAFAAYDAARLRQDRFKALQSTPLPVLRTAARYEDLRRETDAAGRDLAARLTEALEARCAAAHEDEARAASHEALARKFSACEGLATLTLDLTPNSGSFAILSGTANISGAVIPADAELESQFLRAAEALDATGTTGHRKTPADLPRVRNLVRDGDRTKLGFANSWWSPGTYFETLPILYGGRPALCLANTEDTRRGMGAPAERFETVLDAKPSAKDETPVARLAVASRLTAAVLGQMGRGMSRIIPGSSVPSQLHVTGRVVSQFGDSLVPNRPMPGALVRFRLPPNPSWGPMIRNPGQGREIVVTADWYGRFRLPAVFSEMLTLDYPNIIQMDAAVVNPRDGAIAWALSQKSENGQPYNIRWTPLGNFERTSVTAVLFRSSPIQLFPMVDPSTLLPYASGAAIETQGQSAPRDFKLESGGGGLVFHVSPDSRLQFTFLKGRKENANLLDIRAFALGAEGAADGASLTGRSELAGAGYLAADHPSLVNIEFDTAVSMAQVNARRLAVQARYGMTDPMLDRFSRTAIELAGKAQALAQEGRIVEARQAAGESIAYSANIHPVIRKNASDAIVGILFYLFLSIPFVLFMEKLLVGHPDIRGQILGMGVIFGLLFLALWSFHPAFQLVRSTYMILLGFITFALAAGVGAFVSARFSRDIGELHRRARQEIETADVSRASAAATAFLLGLNNLRKRAVRTGLTVATLVLITFVMICFTSIRTDLADIEFPLGKAPYTGLLLRERSLQDVASIVAPTRERFGDRHWVTPRGWGGSFTVNLNEGPKRREFTVQRVFEAGATREATVYGLLGLSTEEAKVTSIEQVFHGQPYLGWFKSDSELSCFLPQTVADKLQLLPEDVTSGKARVKISGRDYQVLGIFRQEKLDALLDLDGQSLLPIDVVALRAPPMTGDSKRSAESAELPEDQPRLPAEAVILTPFDAMPERTQVASVAVGLAADKASGKAMGYGEARKLVTAHLERSGEAAYYGLDGISFFGGKFRMQSVEGLLDLILPILISALTVLNTMRGSVYERRSELYVFNAVGLAPNHIRYLFLAEACVYAVVGAVGGYLLAQGVSFGLDVLGLKKTLGLTMNYSSLSVIIVTLAIMGVVVASSILPARMAARLAAPAEHMTRQRATAEADVLTLDLPFTFNRRDRIAIVPYMADWFGNYGEGSSGEFFSSPAEIGVRMEEYLSTPPEIGVRREATGLAPFVRTTTWLKPYDLGVSQTVEVVVRFVPETRDHLATVILTRRSGDKESWERCCHAFMGMLRKRFLTWRAVADGDRQALLERGKKLLTEGTTGSS